MVNRKYLKEFYIERLYKHFKGNIGKYGRADDFFEELMLTPPRMILINEHVDENYNSEDCIEECVAHFMDPLGLAEMVVRERAEVALEWSELTNDVISKGTDQLELRKQMLNRMMGI